MTWATFGLFAALTVAAAVLIREDLRRAVRRRELRDRRRADVHRFTVAMRGMAAGFAALAPAANRAAEQIREFGIVTEAEARRSAASPFPPSKRQKGRP